MVLNLRPSPLVQAARKSPPALTLGWWLVGHDLNRVGKCENGAVKILSLPPVLERPSSIPLASALPAVWGLEPAGRPRIHIRFQETQCDGPAPFQELRAALEGLSSPPQPHAAWPPTSALLFPSIKSQQLRHRATPAVCSPSLN